MVQTREPSVVNITVPSQHQACGMNHCCRHSPCRISPRSQLSNQFVRSQSRWEVAEFHTGHIRSDMRHNVDHQWLDQCGTMTCHGPVWNSQRDFTSTHRLVGSKFPPVGTRSWCGGCLLQIVLQLVAWNKGIEGLSCYWDILGPLLQQVSFCRPSLHPCAEGTSVGPCSESHSPEGKAC